MISFVKSLSVWLVKSQAALSCFIVRADNFFTVVPYTSRSVSAQGDYDCEPDLPGGAFVFVFVFFFVFVFVIVSLTCQGMPPKVRRRK